MLEIFSLMAKEKKGAAPELSLRQKKKEELKIRQRRQKRSRGSEGSKKRQLRHQEEADAAERALDKKQRQRMKQIGD